MQFVLQSMEHCPSSIPQSSSEFMIAYFVVFWALMKQFAMLPAHDSLLSTSAESDTVIPHVCIEGLTLFVWRFDNER